MMHTIINCKTCGVVANRKHPYQKYCKPCGIKARLESKNKGALLYLRRKQSEDPRFTRRAQLMRQYGMPLEFWDDRLNAQEGRCAICFIKPAKTLSIDHDHSTQIVRGALCNPCNAGLGFFRENAVNLLNAAVYIHYYNKKQMKGGIMRYEITFGTLEELMSAVEDLNTGRKFRNGELQRTNEEVYKRRGRPRKEPETIAPPKPLPKEVSLLAPEIIKPIYSAAQPEHHKEVKEAEITPPFIQEPEPKKALTRDEVLALFNRVHKESKGKIVDCRAILVEHGITRISELKEEQYEAFAASCKAKLGG